MTSRFAVAVLFAALAAACGGSGGDATSTTDVGQDAGLTPVVTQSTGGTEGGPSPVLFGPASRFVPSEEDLQGYYRADTSSALGVGKELYGQIGPFKNSATGQDLAAEWGYEEGFIVGFDPAGLLSAVVQGNYWVTTEAHIFQTVEGAEKAYKQYVSFYEGTEGVESQPLKGLGNESSAWRAIGDKLGSTDLDSVYHRFVMRRGNVIFQVETLGALPYMTPDAAREVAIIMDERALGERPAPTPTPSGSLGQPGASAQ